jgi:hypothetical protein
VQEKIVYFLGAGFSAPLGLPVMSDFYRRSKDLYYSDPQSYESFGAIFKMIDNMAKAKNYYHLDLFNIEEILSILEMEDYVEPSGHREAYTKYLRDVILAYTPPFPERGVTKGGLFSSDDVIDSYIGFVASLFGVWFDLDPEGILRAVGRVAKEVPLYSVISLNYDLALERSLNVLRRMSPDPERFAFATSVQEAYDPDRIPVAKLHGSVEPLTIVPPTWNKVASDEVKASWQLAYRLLADATQIRFLGYSMPVTDTYVRYLLESAVLQSQHLHRIDVLCLDDGEHSLEKHYRSLIAYRRFRFASKNIRSYLESINLQAQKNPMERVKEIYTRLSFGQLEKIHERYMA